MQSRPVPAGLSSGDRKLLLAAGVLAAAIIGATLLFAPLPENTESEVPSSYSTSKQGSQAAFLLLQQATISVERWQQPPLALRQVNPYAVLILAEPGRNPTASERRAVVDFVQRGGRLLICGNLVARFFGGRILRPQPQGAHEVSVSNPNSPFLWNVKSVSMPDKGHWKPRSPEGTVLYSNKGGALGMEWPLGQGRVLWWSSAAPLTNAGIRQADNLQLFLNAVTTGKAVPAVVYWDEYFHGARSSLWSYAAVTSLRWLPWQLLMVAAAAVFGWSRRWGPLFLPRVEPRLAPLEFVEMLGGVYRRAGATDVAVGVERSHLRLLLTRRLAPGQQASDAWLSQLAEERLGWDGGELLSTLNEAGSAETSRPPARRALSLVERLRKFEALLTRGTD